MLGWHGTVMMRVRRRKVLVRDDDTVLGTHRLLPLVRFPYAFPSSLAGTSRLVVPARPYIVKAAPDLTPDPGIDLPPASTGHCDDRRRVSHPARFPSAPRGARVFSSTQS